MNYNTIHQVNWTFIIFTILSYIIISILIIKLLVINPRINIYSTLEENQHLLPEINNDMSHLDENDIDTDILISMENNYINDIETLYNIETNN